MLTRRAIHRRLVAMAMASTLPRVGFVAVDGAVSAADEFLNRLSFGANEASRAEYASMGALGWLEAQLAMAASDPGLDTRLDEARLRIRCEAGDDPEHGKWHAVDEMRRRVVGIAHAWSKKLSE